MQTITPRSLITSSLRLLAVTGGAASPVPTTEELTDGIEVANQLIDAWATHELIIPIHVRELFTISAYQQSLTIGSGGSLNTIRPLTIDAAAIWFNPASVLSVTSITRVSTTATVTQAAHPYLTGMMITIAGATQSAYNGTQTITKTGANTYTYAVTGAPTTPATGTITAQDAISQAYETYMGQFTYAAYIADPLKGTTSPWPTRFYYEPTFSAGFGTIFIWPNPTQTNTLVLYMARQLAALDPDALDTAVILAPGYARALRSNVAVELMPEYPRAEDSQIARIERMAQTSLADIKRQNYRPTVLSTGEAGAMFGWRFGSNVPPNIYQGP